MNSGQTAKVLDSLLMTLPRGDLGLAGRAQSPLQSRKPCGLVTDRHRRQPWVLRSNENECCEKQKLLPVCLLPPLPVALPPSRSSGQGRALWLSRRGSVGRTSHRARHPQHSGRSRRRRPGCGRRYGICSTGRALLPVPTCWTERSIRLVAKTRQRGTRHRHDAIWASDLGLAEKTLGRGHPAVLRHLSMAGGKHALLASLPHPASRQPCGRVAGTYGDHTGN